MFTLSWVELKSMLDAGAVHLKWAETPTTYELYAVDTGFAATCPLSKGSTECTDFETNYKPNYTQTATPLDTDGAPIQKGKIVPAGWAYQLRGMDISIGVFDSVVSKDAWGVDKTDIVVSHYDASDQQITDPANIGQAVRTLVTFEPLHDYAVVGGLIYQDDDPTDNIRIGVIAAPYVPKASGGSVEFGAGLNLKHIGKTGSVNMDGRNPKILTYDATYHTSMLHINIFYPAGMATHTFHLLFEIFNPPGA